MEFEPTAAPTPVAVGWLDMILVTADCDVAESVEKVTVGVVDVDEELEIAVDSGASGSTELRISRKSFAATEKRNSLAAATKRAAVSLNLSAFCGGVRKEKLPGESQTALILTTTSRYAHAGTAVPGCIPIGYLSHNA